jgi:hypothetical protein
MKVQYEGEDVYIKYVSLDMEYALVSKNKKTDKGMFKVCIINLQGLTEKDLPKLNKFIKMK